MTVKTLEDLFNHSISDVYNAEMQMSKALPKLAEAASNADLVKAFKSHLAETEKQIERIHEIVKKTPQIKLEDIICPAMKGLVAEGKETIDEVEKGPIRDSGLIAAAQKAEHYEIATYGTLCALAEELGYSEAKSLLGITLEEEKETDEKLTTIAYSLNK